MLSRASRKSVLFRAMNIGFSAIPGSNDEISSLIVRKSSSGLRPSSPPDASSTCTSTRALVHVLDASGGLEGRNPLDDFRTINEEISSFDPGMAEKPMFIALNKTDLREARDNMAHLREHLGEQGYSRLYEISAATGAGVQALMLEVAAELREIDLREAEQRSADEAAPKRRVYTLGDEDDRAWEVTRRSAHIFDVTGKGIERFTRMTNFDLEDSVRRFQRC